MTAISPRPHLVERAVEAMGDLGRLDVALPASRTQPSPPGDDTAAGGQAEAPALPLPSAEVSSGPPTVSLDALTRAGLVVPPTRGRGRVSEEISVVQNQLLRAMQGATVQEGGHAQVILITSARPGEGKTFTALNVAASLAASGTLPVVLVDTDGKQGSLSHLLGLADTPGLRACAADPRLHPARLLVATEVSHLMLMPYGAQPAGGPGVPPGAAVTAAVLRLAAALPDHAIILDAPPCLSTSDPSALAPIAGQVVMVVEAQRTQRNEVEAALDMVEACSTIQLLLNKSQLTASDTFGVYSHA